MRDLRTLEFFKGIFLKFYVEQTPAVQKKYDYVFVVVRQAERIPIKFFKKLKGSDNIYEIRVEVQSNTYRTFCCFDGNNVVVLFNSIHKKSERTPKTELRKAEKLRKDYFNEK